MTPFHSRLPTAFPWLTRACLAARSEEDTVRIVNQIAAATPEQDPELALAPTAAFAAWVAWGSHVLDITPESVDALLGADAPDTCPPLDRAFVVEFPAHPRLVWPGVGPYAGAYVLPAGYIKPPGPAGVGRFLFGCGWEYGGGVQSDLWRIEPEALANDRTDYGDLDRLMWALCCALADKRISAVVEHPRGSLRRKRLSGHGARSVRRLVLTPDALGVWVRTKIGPAVHPAAPTDRAPVAMHLVHPHLARYWVREENADNVELGDDGRPLTRQGKAGTLVAVRREVREHIRGSGDPKVKRTRLVTE